MKKSPTSHLASAKRRRLLAAKLPIMEEGDEAEHLREINKRLIREVAMLRAKMLDAGEMLTDWGSSSQKNLLNHDE